MFRPHLTGKEVLLIVSMLQEKLGTDKDRGNAAMVALHKKLKLFELKIGNGLISPVFNREQTVEESVGIVSNSTEMPESTQRIRMEELAMRHFKSKEEAGCEDLKLTEEEIAEGKRLELLEYGIDMGMFS